LSRDSHQFSVRRKSLFLRFVRSIVLHLHCTLLVQVQLRSTHFCSRSDIAHHRVRSCTLPFSDSTLWIRPISWLRSDRSPCTSSPPWHFFPCPPSPRITRASKTFLSAAKPVSKSQSHMRSPRQTAAPRSLAYASPENSPITCYHAFASTSHAPMTQHTWIS